MSRRAEEAAHPAAATRSVEALDCPVARARSLHPYPTLPPIHRRDRSGAVYVRRLRFALLHVDRTHVRGDIQR